MDDGFFCRFYLPEDLLISLWISREELSSVIHIFLENKPSTALSTTYAPFYPQLFIYTSYIYYFTLY